MITIQNILCVRCGMAYAEKKVPDGIVVRKKNIYFRTCPNCLEICRNKRRLETIKRNKSSSLRELNSKRMKRDNPMYSPELAKQHGEVMKEKYSSGQLCSPFSDKDIKLKAEESSRFFWKSDKSEYLKKKRSKLMKKKNPSFDPVVRKKASSTFRKKIKNGLIVFPKGNAHWLWKGNRNRCQTIRSRLYLPWIKPIMERDGFSCIHCGKHGIKLEVHHCDKSFEDIIIEILDGRKMNDLDSIEFEKVSDEVIKYHENCSGITLCVECHKKIDPQRR